jgi:hypothetical protein
MKDKLRQWVESAQLFFFRLPKWARTLELFIFHLTLWAIVVCSFIGIIRRAGVAWPKLLPSTLLLPSTFFQSLDSVPFHYLLISAVVAASLIVMLPTLLSRIGEISFGGIKVALAQSEIALDSLHSALDVPDEPLPLIGQLQGHQLYYYERLSHDLYRILDQHKDPNNLDYISRKKYRKLIRYVGRAACLMTHQTKYLDIVLNLQSFNDRKLTWDEQLLIGHAYLVAADEVEASERKSYWMNSASSLEAARRGNANDVSTAFHLGMAVFWLGNWPKGIDLMYECIRMDQTIAQDAKWNIACGLAKQEKFKQCLDTLESIGPGPMWQAIKDDDWFKDTKNPYFETLFRMWCDIMIFESMIAERGGK